MALAIFALIITGVAPIIGWRFAWLNIHWISGLILTFRGSVSHYPVDFLAGF